jgi:hypothetical protein
MNKAAGTLIGMLTGVAAIAGYLAYSKLKEQGMSSDWEGESPAYNPIWGDEDDEEEEEDYE